jgi:hypothetical protein
MYLDSAATMDQTACHLIYTNRNIRRDRYIQSVSVPSGPSDDGLSIEEDGALGDDVRFLLQLNDGMFGLFCFACPSSRVLHENAPSTCGMNNVDKYLVLQCMSVLQRQPVSPKSLNWLMTR